ncbi:MAG: hemerythrin domain-containing protein [Prevotellaceae bacterium]|jgi:regulator of cell morphogenesis and NO signaling|nr:hemerythrin domain-containing protein [Prevotellaceae bacterium]
MLLITPDTKLADALNSNYLLIPVVNRFGIALGFGDKSVEEICRGRGINVEFFTTILNVFSHENYFPQARMLNFDALALVQYLERTHEYYRSLLLPQLERHFNLLMESASEKSKEVLLIEKFFNEYKNELLLHLKREDQATFPYIKAIYHKQNLEDMARRYSIKKFEAEHNNIDEKLYDLKNILIKYAHNGYDEHLRNTVIFDLFRLEKDLTDHTHIENNILTPIVEKMEQALFGSNA